MRLLIIYNCRTSEQLIELLKAHDIEELVDVRTIPKSRHNPQFSEGELAASLREAGMAYKHLARLGGLRRTSKDSVNLGWQNTSFRGFADYMATAEFRTGLDELTALAEKKTVAIMCAEAVHWRCHRSLIADALAVQGWQVLHIQSRKTASPHEPTSFLKVQDGKLTYPKP